MSLFSQSVMLFSETYGKYIARDWYKITSVDFLYTRVVTGTISIRQLNQWFYSARHGHP